MKLILTVTLTALLGLCAMGPASANSTAYYGGDNHYSSNCDTPSKAC